LIEKTKRGIVYTDFEDELGELSAASLRGMEIGADLTRFEQKLRIYLRTHENQLAVQKIRRNRQITATDLDELEQIFIESGIGTEAEINHAKTNSGGLGLFLRSLIGLDREAAAAAFGRFQEGKTFTSAQLRFVNEVIDYLAHNGTITVDVLISPRSPSSFRQAQRTSSPRPTSKRWSRRCIPSTPPPCPHSRQRNDSNRREKLKYPFDHQTGASRRAYRHRLATAVLASMRRTADVPGALRLLKTGEIPPVAQFDGTFDQGCSGEHVVNHRLH
jgi:hypothetical protein